MANTKIISHTSIYAISTIIRNITGLVMLPIYTRYLNPSDYAILELLSMSIDFVGIVIANRIGDAVFRFYMTEPDEAKKKGIISTAFLLAVGLNSVGFLILFAGASVISQAVFGSANYAHFLLLFAITLITEALIRIPLHYIRAREKPWFFLAANVFKLFSQVALNIYFVVSLNLGVVGVIYGALISTSILGAILTVYTLKDTGLHFDLAKAKAIFLFSLPISIGGIASFFTTFGDRFFLTHFQSLETVGLYTLAYKFAFIYYALCFGSFNQMWDAQKYKVFNGTNPNATYRSVFNYLNLFMIAAGLAIALLIKEFLMLMSGQSFWLAANLVPTLLLAYLIHSWASYLNFGLLHSKQTKYIAYSDWGSAGLIFILYFALIPTLGAQGAGLATLLTFIFRAWFLHYHSKNYYDMELNFWPTFKLLTLAIVVWLCSQLLPPLNLWLAIVSKSVMLILFTALAIYLPILSGEERDQILLTLKKIGLSTAAKIPGLGK